MTGSSGGLCTRTESHQRMPGHLTPDEMSVKFAPDDLSAKVVALVQGEAVQGAVVLPVLQHSYGRQHRRVRHMHCKPSAHARTSYT